jgi:hypothetical protein
MAHKNPKIIQKTIDHLSSPDSAFLIHIDKKVDIRLFESIQGEQVFFTERRELVYWGEFSQVQAMLILIRQALADMRNYDYFVLLCGSTYPIRSGDYIRRFLETHRGTEFMTLVKMPAAGYPLSRINTLRLPSKRPVGRLISRVLAKCGMAQRDFRKHLGNLEPYAGHTWWALSKEACQYISDYEKQNKSVVKFFENVFAPDESFFQTILGNSKYRSRIRRNLFYEDWSACGGHPEMISQKHVAFFESQYEVCGQDLDGPGELLFARKLSDESMDVVRQLDEMVKRKEAAREDPPNFASKVGEVPK